MIDEIRDEDPGRHERGEGAQRRRSVRPNVDIFASDEEFVILADVPGLAKADLDITVDGDDLVIDGSIAGRQERESTLPWAYHRRFRLRSHIDRDKIEAHLEGGVLRLTLPRAEPEAAKKVSVE